MASSITRESGVRQVTGVSHVDLWLAVPHGGIREVRRHSAGTQGNSVRTIETDDGHRVVVKSNALRPEWIKDEVAWYARLKQTPLAPLIPDIYAYTDGAFVMRHVQGEDLRTLVSRGLSVSQAKSALTTVLDANVEWIVQQQEQGAPYIHEATNTVQRKQQQDTQNRLHGPLKDKLLADERFAGLSADDLYALPFVYNGAEFRPIEETVRGIMEHLNAAVPTYMLHGDISGNLRLDISTGEVALFDPEFAGPTPVTEDLVRVTKWKTTKLVVSSAIDELSKKDGKLHVGVRTQFPQNVEELHGVMEQEARVFMNRIGEQQSWHLYYLSLAGSYLREAVLSIDRGTNDIAMWALGEMSTAYQQYQHLAQSSAREQRIAPL